MKKKGLSILLSFCLVLVLAVSFSFPAVAASPTYVSGDIVFSFSGFNSVADTVSLKDTGAYSSNSNYFKSSSTYSTGLKCISVDEMHVYLANPIPPNSQVTLEFGFRVWSQYGSTNVNNLSFYDTDFTLMSPFLSDGFDVSSYSYVRTGNFDKAFFNIMTFDTSVKLKEIVLADVDTWFRIDSNSNSNTLYLYFVDCRLSYTPIDNNPNSDVLQQIKNNTGQTTDAVNQQTETVTNGYNNSQMESSNTALFGSISDYESTESQVTDQSVGYIDDASFFDISSQIQLMSCITFCSSWLQSLFVNLGDWGILVMVSLSLALGLMLIGWFKYRK